VGRVGRRVKREGVGFYTNDLEIYNHLLMLDALLFIYQRISSSEILKGKDHE
jgi:hypothetical protein